MTAWIIDLLLIAVFIFMVLAAARRGFVVTVLRLAAWAASIALAGVLSSALAEPIYNAFIAESARGLIAENIGTAVQSSQAAQYAQEVITELPQALRQLAEVAGISTGDLLTGLQASAFTAANAAAVLEQSIVAPIAIAVIRLLTGLALFLLLMIALRFVCARLEKLRRLPVLKQADGLLGAGLGIIKGVLLLFVAALLLRAAAAVAPADGGFALAVENSRIAALLTGFTAAA